MKTETIVGARRAAEAAVADMSDGPLKIAAFQTILTQLLQQGSANDGPKLPTPAARSSVKRKIVGPSSTGTTGRLVTLIEEGIFSQQRSLAEIKQTLAEKGWFYQLQDLGTPLTRLVRRRLLRRTQVAEGGKRIWKYSNY